MKENDTIYEIYTVKPVKGPENTKKAGKKKLQKRQPGNIRNTNFVCPLRP